MSDERPATPTEVGAPVDTPGPELQTRTAHPEVSDGTVEWPSRLGARPELPGYEITDVLGRGGMGVVYKATCAKLGRTVAIKTVLGGAFAGPAALERFWREARAMAALAHPHIVTLFDVSQHGDSLYMAMEFCPGGTLAERITQGPLEPLAAAELIEQLARAVHAAHQAGIVHRDLKPHNVLFTADGTPKLTDFGLAKKLDGDGITKSDVIMGTPGYMSPEQASGQSKQVGPAADVYGLGALLYATLCGRPPFEGESQLATVVKVLTQDPPSPASIRPDVPRSLEAICLRCLAKKPDERYASAAGLAEDLARFRRGESISVPNAAAVVQDALLLEAATTPPPLPSRPKRMRLIVGLAAAVVLLGGLVALLLSLRTPNPDKVFRDFLDAGLGLADAIDRSAPPDELQRAKDRYNSASEKWKALDLKPMERMTVQQRNEADFTLMANRLASAYQGKGQMDELRRAMQELGVGMGEMMKGFLGGLGTKDGFPSGFPFPSIGPTLPGGGPFNKAAEKK